MTRLELIVQRQTLRVRRARGRAFVFLLASGFWLLASSPSPCSAQPTQDAVLRSIGENIDQQHGDPRKLLALLAGGAGLAVLLVVLSNRERRAATPRAINHQGKLLGEMTRAAGLRRGEVRQLKLLAEQLGLSSPVALLLCPSLLEQAVARRVGGVDARVLANLARRFTASS